LVLYRRCRTSAEKCQHKQAKTNFSQPRHHKITTSAFPARSSFLRLSPERPPKTSSYPWAGNSVARYSLRLRSLTASITGGREGPRRTLWRGRKNLPSGHRKIRRRVPSGKRVSTYRE